MTQEKKIEQLTELAKLSPQELAKVLVYTERLRVKRLAKASNPQVWGGTRRGWNLTTETPTAVEAQASGPVMEKRVWGVVSTAPLGRLSKTR
jgi:hypothetical protein